MICPVCWAFWRPIKYHIGGECLCLGPVPISLSGSSLSLPCVCPSPLLSSFLYFCGALLPILAHCSLCFLDFLPPLMRTCIHIPNHVSPSFFPGSLWLSPSLLVALRVSLSPSLVTLWVSPHLAHTCGQPIKPEHCQGHKGRTDRIPPGRKARLRVKSSKLHPSCFRPPDPLPSASTSVKPTMSSKCLMSQRKLSRQLADTGVLCHERKTGTWGRGGGKGTKPSRGSLLAGTRDTEAGEDTDSPGQGNSVSMWSSWDSHVKSKA